MEQATATMTDFDTQRYYPRHLTATKPMPPQTCEFLIVSRNEARSAFEVVSTFDKFNVELAQAYVNQHVEVNRLVFGIFCDFSNAKISPDDFFRELKKIPSVIRVEFDKMENRIFAKYFFPLSVMGNYRGIVMRINPLLSIEKRLNERMGSGGSAIMFDEGVTYALETVEYYRRTFSTTDAAVLLQNIIDGLRATGWGLFEFRKIEDGYFVSIRHPPKLKNGEMAESRFVIGVAAGILESLFGGKWSVFHTHYNASEDALMCRFRRS